MIDMDNLNKRKEARISAASLPKELSGFFLLPPENGATKVTAVDASLSGFGLTSEESPEKFPSGSHVTMYPFGVNKPLKGRVIYGRKEGKATRIGVQLLSSEGYSSYKKKISPLFKKPE